jgi:hypothetical protein
MVSIEPGSDAALQLLYLPGPVGLDRSALRTTAGYRLSETDGTELDSILTEAKIRRKNSPFGLKQFALRAFRFAKSG